MKTAQHTPGPWAIHGHTSDGTEIGTPSLNGNGDYIAMAYSDRDARLIAAAPDLLAALQDLANYVGGWDEPDTHPCGMARLAIAKATGGDHV